MHPDNDFRKSKSLLKKDKPLCPSLLKYIESQGIKDGLNNRPGLLAELCRQIAAEGPFDKEIYERFIRCYWRGIAVLVSRSSAAQELLTKTMSLTVNLEATDSPFCGYFQIRDGRISGGPRMLPFKYQDLRYFGATCVLMRFLNNELLMGYADLSLHVEGHPGLSRIISPVMAKMAQLAKGSAREYKQG